ncbi:PadR family transcriptional regulator [Mycoplasmatota bacterium]|nr:PadR family transcriptional regulator [Mycoplasmatota bacterium]
MDTQFKKGIIEVCVLNELNKEDTYGYKLVKNLSKTLEVGESTIYTMLRRLTKDNVLDLYERASSDGPTRKYYTLTGIGKERLFTLKSEWESFSVKVNKLIGGNK